MPALTPKAANRALWTTQILLAAIFMLAGGSKLVKPIEAMQQGPVILPEFFLRFIGVAEACGALGLVLPGLFRTRVELTHVAAAGLVTIMIGAVVLTVVTMGVAPAIFPLVVGLAATWIAVSRRNTARRIRSRYNRVAHSTLAHT